MRQQRHRAAAARTVVFVAFHPRQWRVIDLYARAALGERNQFPNSAINFRRASGQRSMSFVLCRLIRQRLTGIRQLRKFAYACASSEQHIRCSSKPRSIPDSGDSLNVSDTGALHTILVVGALLSPVTQLWSVARHSCDGGGNASLKPSARFALFCASIAVILKPD